MPLKNSVEGSDSRPIQTGVRFFLSAPTLDSVSEFVPVCFLGAYAGVNWKYGGGGASRKAMRRRFCAMAASKNSSRAPVGPRRRSRSSLMIRFRCANNISTFFRFLRDRR